MRVHLVGIIILAISTSRHRQTLFGGGGGGARSFRINSVSKKKNGTFSTQVIFICITLVVL